MRARGFFLAGVASAHLDLLTVLIRKHKKFFDKIDHQKVTFTNWKNEVEALTILKGSMPQVKRVLIIDDILDTGRSLRAGQELLRTLGIEIVGAFYLLNAAKEEVYRSFSFPIHSAKEHKLL